MSTLNEKLEKIINNIKNSKNYKMVYVPTIKRIVEDTAKRYPLSKVEKESKKRLHQICGIYSSERKLRESTNENLSDILQSHSSTSERISFLSDFYDFIFSNTKNVKTIVEPACGLNPLTYPFMKTDAKYFGSDIDLNSVNFVSTTVNHMKLDEKVSVTGGDIYENQLPVADMYFLFKLLPVLEQQIKRSSEDLLHRIRANYIAVTFPTKSISSKEKGMEKFYSEFFENILRETKYEYIKKSFENELVYVVTKHSQITL